MVIKRRSSTIDDTSHRRLIKLVGVGEKLDALEVFDPSRMASRILDMGDVVALVEKAAEAIEEEEAMRMAERMASGKFDMNDFLTQLRQLQKWVALAVFLVCPGLGKMQKQIAPQVLTTR